MATTLLSHVTVYALTCGTCGHQTSSLDRDRTAAAMLDRLRYAHSDPILDGHP